MYLYYKQIFVLPVSTGRDCCEESLAPDDKVFKSLAVTYASHNPVMGKGDACPPEVFKNGITNGAMWYEVKGKHKLIYYLNSKEFLKNWKIYLSLELHEICKI